MPPTVIRIVVCVFDLIVKKSTQRDKDDKDWKKNPPIEGDGYVPPKKWDGKKVKNPNGKGSGYPAKNGDVWVPTDHKGTHAPHWDVQHSGAGRKHTPVYPKR